MPRPDQTRFLVLLLSFIIRPALLEAVMMMNFAAQKALAQLLHVIRDDWDVAGAMTALGNAREAGKADDLRAICDAAVAAALDGRNRTPAIIPLAGPHWTRAATGPERRHYDRRLMCGICSRLEHVCKAINSDDHAFVTYDDLMQQALADRAAREARARSAKS